RVDPQPQRLRADRERQTGALALLLALLGMSSAADAQDFAAQRARLVAEVEAMYAETSRETGMSAMSAAVRVSLGKVERHRFVPKAQQSMAYRNQPLPIGGGHAGWPEKGPFDGIIVTAAAPRIPSALTAQLKPGGRMVIPVGGEGWVQHLKVVTKRADGGYDERDVIPVRFVPLVPKSGG